METENKVQKEKRLRKDIPFPECYKECEIVKHLGAGECESVCPYKFNKDGEPIRE